MINDIVPISSAPRPLAVRPQRVAERTGRKFDGHFLSIIAFDGNVTLETFNSVIGIQSRTRAWRGWKFFAGSGQGRSRNECAHWFLHKTDCEYHFLSDADLLFTDDHVMRLRAHPEAKDSIICGAYPKKQDKIEFCFNAIKDGPTEPNGRHLLEIAKGGTGFMQIPRSAYEKVQAKFPHLVYECDYDKEENGRGVKKMAFFLEQVMHDPAAGYVRHMTEDWMFCHMAREAGVKIYMDFGTTKQPWLMHRGPILYPLPSEIERERVQEELDEAKKEIALLKSRLLDLADQPSA